MSIVTKETIKCPSCGQENNISIWQTLNTEINKAEKEKLLNGTLMKFNCDNCGHSCDLCYPMLYHDMNKKIMIYLAPSEKKESDARKMFNSQIIKNVDNDYIQRIVSNQNELREKAIIFESNLDDRIIEIIKLIYAEQAKQQVPDLLIDEILMYCEDNSFFFQINGTHSLTTEMDLSHYEDIKNLFNDKLIDDEELIVDRKWAERMFDKLNIDNNENNMTETKNNKVDDILKCNICGMVLPKDSEFCQYCGNKIKSVVLSGDADIKNKNSSILNSKIISKKDKLKTKDEQSKNKALINARHMPKKVKTTLITAIVLCIMLPIVVIASMCINNYFTAHKKAESAVAIYLSKETNKTTSSSDDFTSFKKTYYVVKLSKNKYIVDLSGSAYAGLGSKNRVVSFSAKVKIDVLTGKTNINWVKYNKKKY